MGIKVLKNKLSQYLAMVRQGETLLVTDRDEVIAEIHRPVWTDKAPASRLEAWMKEQRRLGQLSESRRQGSGLKTPLSLPAATPGLEWERTYREARQDRRAAAEAGLEDDDGRR